MKKLLIMISLTAAIALLLSSCGGKPEMQDGPGMENPEAEDEFPEGSPNNPENEPEDEHETDPESPYFDENQFLRDIAPNLEMLRECDYETFGAETDFDKTYYAAMKEGEIALLYPSDEELPEGYNSDPAAASYYPVSNFKTNQEVYDNLNKYMTPAMIETAFFNDFFEFDGELYMVRGGRGYGTLLPDLESVKYAGEENKYLLVTVDYYLFDEFAHSVTLRFNNSGNGWFLASRTVNEE